MKITISIPMSDILALNNVLPAMARSEMDNFIAKLKEYEKSKEKDGMKVKASFNAFTGFEFIFEGSTEQIVAVLEKNSHTDLKVMLEGYASATLLMMGARKASEEAFKARQK